MDIKNEKVLNFRELLLNTQIDKISYDLQLDYVRSGQSMQIVNLNLPKKALLTVINQYGRILYVKEVIKRFFEMYKSVNSTEVNIGMQQYQIDRINVGMKLVFIINRIEEIADLYDKFLKVAIEYAKKLKDIEDPDSIKNPRKWKSLNIEHRNELVFFIYSRLITCSSLFRYCNELQSTVLILLRPMHDIFNSAHDTISIDNFIKKCSNLSEDKLEDMTKLYLKHNVDILLEKIVEITSPIYAALQRFNDEKESFKDDLRKWKEKAYPGEIIEDSDADTTPGDYLAQASDFEVSDI